VSSKMKFFDLLNVANLKILILESWFTKDTVHWVCSFTAVKVGA
jgi:hypothetical protein